MNNCFLIFFVFAYWFVMSVELFFLMFIILTFICLLFSFIFLSNYVSFFHVVVSYHF